MFESITKKRKNRLINYFGWALLGLCCLVFVFMFDVNQGFLGTTGAAAEVNGEAISLRAFSELVDRMESQGNSAGGDAESQRRLRQNAINMLVSQQLVFQNSSRENIYVSDDEVAEFIMDIDGFKEDGRFSRLRYKTYLNQTRKTEDEFEGMLRKMLVERKMLGLIEHVAKEIPLVADTEKQLDQAKINVSYLAFNKFNSKSSSNPSPKEAEDFISSNGAEVKKKYDDNIKDYLVKEQVKARHILIKTDPSKKDSEKEAEEKIKKIKSELTAENFSKMAEKHSEDTGSKKRGGDLGFFTRGKMVPPFEKYCFSAEIGKISEPIKSKFGYHVIIVDAKKAEKQQTYDEVKVQIASEMVREKRFGDLVQQMEDHLKAKEMDKIEALASANGLRWKDTGLFSINEQFIPGVGTVKEFMDGAMQLSTENPISRSLVRYKTNRYIMKLKDAKIDTENKSKKNPQLDFFKQMMEQQRANIVMQSWIESLKKTAKIKVNQQIVR